MVADINEIRDMLRRGLTVLDVVLRTGVKAEYVSIIQAQMRAQKTTRLRANSKWAPHMPLITAMWNKGKSASQIAEAIGLLGERVSRNAVIGVLHRRGFVRNGTKAEFNADRAAVMRNKAARARRAKDKSPAPKQAQREALALIFAAEPPPPMNDPVIPVEQRVTIETITDNACRWPYGEGSEIHFCAAPRVNGLSYCAPHCARAFAPPKPRQRRVVVTPAAAPAPIPTFADAVAEEIKV